MERGESGGFLRAVGGGPETMNTSLEAGIISRQPEGGRNLGWGSVANTECSHPGHRTRDGVGGIWRSVGLHLSL